VGNWAENAGGAVALVANAVEPVPPPGRALQICQVADVIATLKEVTPNITCVGHAANAPESWKTSLLEAVPKARQCVVGKMQCPPFDGPVDLR
jgi:hypothetical protein